MNDFTVMVDPVLRLIALAPETTTSSVVDGGLPVLQLVPTDQLALVLPVQVTVAARALEAAPTSAPTVPARSQVRDPLRK